MKRHLPFFFLLFSLASLLPAYGQTTTIWPWPWTQAEEYAYPFLPGGGWNTPGSFSPGSLAMGETYLTARNSTAGFLNPAYLSYISAPQFSLSYRYTQNRYKTSSWGTLDLPAQAGSPETRTFRRETDFLDSAGLVLPFDDWVLAANYFLFQEYNFPEIRGPFWGYPVPLAQPEVWIGYPQSVKQTGNMKGLNLAFSWRLTKAFSLGASASYVFGDIDRVQEMPDVYVIQARRGPERMLPASDPYPSTIQNSAYSAKGFFFNLGFTWAPNSQIVLGLSLRPPFSLDLQTEIETMDSAGQRSYFSGDNYFKHPLVAVASVLFHPLEPFHFTLDLSYWGWGEFSTDLDPGWFGNYDFKSVLKFNLGAEYDVRLPFDSVDTLVLRAGFIYDPQPYRYSPSIARDSLTFGFSLPVGRLDLQFAAKLGLSTQEKNRFHSAVLQAGAAYRF